MPYELNMEDRIKKIEETTSRTSITLDKLVSAIQGDDLGNVGLINTLKNQRTEIETLKSQVNALQAFKERMQDRAKWGIALISVMTSALAFIVSKVLSLIFK